VGDSQGAESVRVPVERVRGFMLLREGGGQGGEPGGVWPEGRELVIAEVWREFGRRPGHSAGGGEIGLGEKWFGEMAGPGQVMSDLMKHM